MIKKMLLAVAMLCFVSSTFANVAPMPPAPRSGAWTSAELCLMNPKTGEKTVARIPMQINSVKCVDDEEVATGTWNMSVLKSAIPETEYNNLISAGVGSHFTMVVTTTPSTAPGSYSLDSHQTVLGTLYVHPSQMENFFVQQSSGGQMISLDFGDLASGERLTGFAYIN